MPSEVGAKAVIYSKNNSLAGQFKAASFGNMITGTGETCSRFVLSRTNGKDKYVPEVIRRFQFQN